MKIALEACLSPLGCPITYFNASFGLFSLCFLSYLCHQLVMPVHAMQLNIISSLLTNGIQTGDQRHVNSVQFGHLTSLCVQILLYVYSIQSLSYSERDSNWWPSSSLFLSTITLSLSFNFSVSYLSFFSFSLSSFEFLFLSFFLSLFLPLNFFFFLSFSLSLSCTIHLIVTLTISVRQNERASEWTKAVASSLFAANQSNLSHIGDQCDKIWRNFATLVKF